MKAIIRIKDHQPTAVTIMLDEEDADERFRREVEAWERNQTPGRMLLAKIEKDALIRMTTEVVIHE